MPTTDTIRVQGRPSVVVKLTEVDDAAFALVNGRHFALTVGKMTDLTGAMRDGVNELQFVVKNKGQSTPIGGSLPGGPWKGHFELYIGSRLAGTYQDDGHDGLGTAEHTVADIQILAN